MLTVPGSMPTTRGIADVPGSRFHGPGSCSRFVFAVRTVNPEHERGTGNMQHGTSACQFPRYISDRLCIQDEVIALEQTGDARLVDLHLEVADAERPEHGRAVAFHGVVGDLDAFDAERRHGVEVRSGAQAAAARP